MALQNGMRVLLTQRGARVLGLFPTPDAENLLWTNSALDDAAHLRDFITGGGWNLGGERCWIAPEIQYNVRDRNDFFGTLATPPAIDPGHYEMTVQANAVYYEQEIALEAYNIASGEKRLRVSRAVRPVPNPLPDAVMDGAHYGGYEQTATLTELNATPIMSEIWNLVQLNAGGTLLIPVIGDAQYSEYFGSPPDDAKYAQGNHLRIAITGERQFKVGYKSVCISGRMGYWNRLADGREYLLVRCFFNNPSSIYAEEPPDKPGVTGHSVHVYNDGGEFGGARRFGEMECSGQTIGGRSGKTSSTDTFVMWAYTGTSAAIRRIAGMLLGVAL